MVREGEFMSKKKVKTNATRILEEKNISINLYEYPHGSAPVDGVSAAGLIGKNVEEVYKTLVTKSNSGEIIVCVIPVAKHLDLKKAARASKNKSVDMLDLKDITKVTGYVRGGCSPVGMKKSYTTFIDSSAKHLDNMIVSAGKIGHQVELNPVDLAKVVGAEFVDLTLSE